MPLIAFEGPTMSKEQKALLVKEFTKDASEILNMPAETIIISIRENNPDNVGVGGILLSDKNNS